MMHPCARGACDRFAPVGGVVERDNNLGDPALDAGRDVDAHHAAQAGHRQAGFPAQQPLVVEASGAASVGEVTDSRTTGSFNAECKVELKFTGDAASSWCRTGDTEVMDADGYLWYQGRSDDVFKAAGYRIGPSEIENCLVKHRAVANAAVVPRPLSR